KHFDVLGASLVTGALTALVYGVVRTDTLSWGAPGVLGPLAIGLTLLLAFVFVEGRVALAPLVPLSIFRRRRLRAANIVIFLLYSAVFAMWFFLSLYLQQVLHYDALKAGFSFLPMTLAVVLGTTFAPRAAARLGEARVLALGMLLAAAGLILLTGVRPGDGYLASVLPGGVLSALGLGLSLVPATIAAVSGVPSEESGLASGLLNSSRLIGGALGLAVLSTIAASQTHGDVHGGATAASALSSGFQLAFATGAALSALGALASLVLLRRPRAVLSEAGVEDPTALLLGDEGELPVAQPVDGVRPMAATAYGRRIRGGGQRARALAARARVRP
ncbi:MAG TPA: MFS transporter, partial [Solirubrobacteraceae bacterium]|nr:MFS transporter [Solirubrobacteraceae bacterium]